MEQSTMLIGIFIVIMCAGLSILFAIIGISEIKHKKEQKELFKLEIGIMEDKLAMWKRMIDGIIPMEDLMNIKMGINMWTDTINILSSRYSISGLHSWDYLNKYYKYNDAKKDIESAKRIMGYKNNK